MISGIWWIVIAISVLDLCIYLYVNRRFLKKRILRKKLQFKSEKKEFYVFRIEHIPQRERYFLGIRFLKFGVIPEEYNVYYIHHYKECIFNNKELYEKAKAGMKFFYVTIHRGYDKKGRVKYVYHTLD